MYLLFVIGFVVGNQHEYPRIKISVKPKRKGVPRWKTRFAWLKQEI